MVHEAVRVAVDAKAVNCVDRGRNDGGGDGFGQRESPWTAEACEPNRSNDPTHERMCHANLFHCTDVAEQRSCQPADLHQKTILSSLELTIYNDHAAI